MSRHCVVLAGGLGTRIREITDGKIPKVLVPVLGEPFLKWKLESLQSMGVTDVTLLVGELGNLIEDYVWHHYPTGLSIQCFHDGPSLLGTAGSIRQVLHKLPETFWVTYGDSYVVANLDEAELKFTNSNYDGIMTLLHNKDALEPSNTDIHDDRVSLYEKNTQLGLHEWIDYGLLYLKRDDFLDLSVDSPTDLGVVLQSVIRRERMMMHEATTRFWDVGTPEALMATEGHFRSLF
jgi:D-glycero-D-manno-heptose 1,7-bisphosphate phosphatase